MDAAYKSKSQTHIHPYHMVKKISDKERIIQMFFGQKKHQKLASTKKESTSKNYQKQ